MKQGVLFISLSIFVMNCGGLFLKMYGMKKFRPLSNAEIRECQSDFGVDVNASYVLDTAKYFAFLRTIDTNQFALAQKNHAQPLQALYFNTEGKLICWYVNCYAGGFPNLKWDRIDTAFNSYPPSQQAPLDTFLRLDKMFTYMTDVDSSWTLLAPYVGGTVIVFWNRWMGRQSKRLIELVKKNDPGEHVQVYYVNNDNLYAGMEMK